LKIGATPIGRRPLCLFLRSRNPADGSKTIVARMSKVPASP
jgi:hypothetical protein